jgi:Spy/CpxP family protein refolding chaperone
MNVKTPILAIAATLSLMVAGTEAAGQRPPDLPLEQRPAPRNPGRDRAADPDGLGPGQILNMLDAWAIVQAQETLQLGDDQYGEFVTRLKRLQQTRRRSMQARNGVLQDLRRLVGPQARGTADDNAIQERLRALNELDERSAAEMRRAYEELDQVLTPTQRARFRLFEETLERRKIDLLKRAQQGAAGRRRQ